MDSRIRLASTRTTVPLLSTHSRSSTLERWHATTSLRWRPWLGKTLLLVIVAGGGLLGFSVARLVIFLGWPAYAAYPAGLAAAAALIGGAEAIARLRSGPAEQDRWVEERKGEFDSAALVAAAREAMAARKS